MIVLFFHMQRDNLTEYLQIKFITLAWFWLEELSVTIDPGFPW